MITLPQDVEPAAKKPDFEFKKCPRRFPVIDALPYRWPRAAAEAGECIVDWQDRAGLALAKLRLSKATMLAIASHTSQRDGTCPLTDRALSRRSGRSIASTRRDIGRLKKMGFLIAEINDSKGYRNRTRRLILAVPDQMDDDQRIPPNDDQRIPPGEGTRWCSTYTPYVERYEQGERRDV